MAISWDRLTTLVYMAGRIIVAEDDPKQGELLRRYLGREGHDVIVATDGRQAIDEVRRRRPDLLVLDLMMPRVDGFDVCRVLRYESDVPIIMVTAKSTEDDLLLGLDLGADDYITKPYSPRELVARVRSILRRSVDDDCRHVHEIGDLRVDTRRHEVHVAAEQIDVTPKEFDVLAALAAEPGRAFTRSSLLESAFGFDYEGLERTIDVHIANLRKKIEAVPADPRYLVTVFGVGYRMADPASFDA